MLKITNDAMRICSATVKQLSLQANTKLLRLVSSDGDIVIAFEMPQKDDELVPCNGTPILAIANEVADRVGGRVLQVDRQGRFVLAPEGLAA